MKKITKTLLIGASLAAGMSAIASSPAQAFTISGTDVIKYDANSTSTFVNPNADVNTLLGGNAANPGGNIELFASSETLTNAQYLASTARTSITGDVAGKTLTLSSLTASDWFGSSLTTTYGANNFANTWFNAFLTAAGQGSASTATKAFAYNTFFGLGGFQRSSDPNISYVTTDGADMKIGLAGHFDLKAFYAASGTQFAQFAALLPNGFQASEVVKASYGDTTQFLYSFSATASGLTNSAGVGADNKSHSGNYEVSLKNVIRETPKATPEPSVMLGMLAVGGVFAAQRKLKKAAQA